MASRSPEKGAAAAKEVQASSIKGKVSSIQLDVTDEASIAAAVKQVEKDHGRLDVLVNNAGIYSKAPTLKEQFETTFQANVTGVALVTEALLPLLLKSSHPYLIHVSSGLGSLSEAADPTNPVYGVDAPVYRASKAALDMLAIQDAKILGKQGVKVFAFCPGLVESNLRGTSEAERKAGGGAGDPMESGRTMLSIIDGSRDADVGKFVHKDGVYTW